MCMCNVSAVVFVSAEIHIKCTVIQSMLQAMMSSDILQYVQLYADVPCLHCDIQ